LYTVVFKLNATNYRKERSNRASKRHFAPSLPQRWYANGEEEKEFKKLEKINTLFIQILHNGLTLKQR